MTDSEETRIALLERDVSMILRDAEKREKLQDERHAAVMAQLRHLEMAVSARSEFTRGMTTAARVAWAGIGSLVTGLLMWILTRGQT